MQAASSNIVDQLISRRFQTSSDRLLALLAGWDTRLQDSCSKSRAAAWHVMLHRSHEDIRLEAARLSSRLLSKCF